MKKYLTILLGLLAERGEQTMHTHSLPGTERIARKSARARRAAGTADCTVVCVCGGGATKQPRSPSGRRGTRIRTQGPAT